MAIYDYAENAIYVANAGPAPSDYEGDGEPAYNRILTRVDMTSLGLKVSTSHYPCKCFAGASPFDLNSYYPLPLFWMQNTGFRKVQGK